MISETLVIEQTAPIGAVPSQTWSLQWTPIVVGALTASALSLILLTFAAALGLGVASTAPTWRDASVALWLLSGIYLVFQALISFGCGGYFAGRVRMPSPVSAEDLETRDGLHGVASWALAVVIGVILTAVVAGFASRTAQPTSASEPSILSYELDRLLRAPHRQASVDIVGERAEAARILVTSSSQPGVAADNRNYLVQKVSALTGLAGPDAEKRVDTAISNAKRVISRSRAASIILAFSSAAALLFGAVAAWAGAEAGGRHRDGEPIADWMRHENRRMRRQV